LIFFAALLLIVARFLSVWAGTPFPIDLVTSDSMSPSLMEGDVVAWTPTNIEDLEVGDVIVFKSYIHWPDEKIVVHRVSDITTNRKGNLLLETKGDKNEWTDQAGPHIPEPYIREENLMGKVISIGQQPLKLPFIGYLGVWINQGLEMISQPTQPKESMSFIGIFTPLTISIVLLVVLIFILPEKARTIKEKIRLNIFGRRPLNLKRTILMFLIIYIVFLTVIHAFAHDSITASVGVQEGSPDSNVNFGKIQPGTESSSKDLPLINPGIMPVKGVLFGQGDMRGFVTRQVFNIERGETKSTLVKAAAPQGAADGSYSGEIILYSSPLWLLFPDDFIQDLVDWSPEGAILMLDLLAAIFLTFVTFFILTLITFIGDRYTILSINRSWQYPSLVILKKEKIRKAARTKENIKRKLSKGLGWIMKIDFSEDKIRESTFSKIGKPFIATLLIIPILILLEDQILAMLFLFTMSIAIAHMIIQSNLIILSKEQTLIELITLSIGAIGIYLLLFSLLLIPFALLSWAIARLFRNLKERKDILLSMEGSCDL
jgi:signal peptidase